MKQRYLAPTASLLWICSKDILTASPEDGSDDYGNDLDW